MSIIIALNSVITVMRRTHVSGDEAKAFGQAIEILTKCVHALEETKKEEKADEDHNEQRQND